MFLELDEISLLVTTDTDVSVSYLEREVNQSGYTLNYHPLPHKEVLLADALNERWPNLYATAFGGLEELCVQVSLARPDGQLWQNRLTPRSATGPSFKNLCIGAQESFGVPFQAVLRIYPLPELQRLNFFVFSEERHQELFIQALKRQCVELPLFTEITAVKHKRELVFGSEEWVLASAFWGGEQQTLALQNYLQELVEAKHGRHVQLSSEQDPELWLKRLHQIAIRAWQAQQLSSRKSSNKEVSDSHQRLVERVRKVS